MVASLARIALEGGGSILVEAPDAAGGPVKAGRISETIHELPTTLQAALEPVTKTAKAVLDQFREACPDEVGVEFGVDLSVATGAVITKGEAACHLKVTMTWKNSESTADPH
jgi:hypothetical protein